MHVFRSASWLVVIALATIAVAQTAPSDDWLDLDYGGFRFSLPPTFVQTDVQGEDSLVEEFVDLTAGVAVRLDYGLYSDSGGKLPEGARAETVRVGDHSATLISYRRSSDATAFHRISLHGPKRNNVSLAVLAICRDASGIELARQIFTTIRFADPSSTPAAEDRPQDFLTVVTLRECRRALHYRRSSDNDFPEPLLPPDPEAAMLALEVLRTCAETNPAFVRRDGRLALPLIRHESPNVRHKALDFLGRVPPVKGSLQPLCDALNNISAPDRSSAGLSDSRIADALVRLSDARALPTLRRALSRGLNVSHAIGALGTEEDVEPLLHASRADNRALTGLRTLVTRSNHPEESWMRPSSSFPNWSEFEAHLNRWEHWWQENKPMFRVTALPAGRTD